MIPAAAGDAAPADALSASSASWAWSTSRPTRSRTAAASSTPQPAIAHGLRSSRPRARRSSTSAASRPAPARTPVAAEEELRRVAARDRGPARGRHRAQLSIDTSKAAVAAAALDAGATLVNDVTALPRRPGDGRRWSPTRGVDCCLMHMLGEPRTMQDDPRYDDVVSEVKAFLEERLAFAVARRDRRGADPARPRHRLRQDGRAQPRAAAPPRRARRDRAARS